MRISAALFFGTLLLLTGCASNIPEPIRSAAPGNIAIDEARSEPARFVGETVRWGGTIIETRNHQDATWVLMLGRPLDAEGRPKPDTDPTGRFIAAFSGFLDPAVYEAGREMTVRGTLAEPVTLKVGEFPYRYPVVKVENRYLWAKRQEVSYPPYWDDYYWPPFWGDPWYPYGFHRYPYW